METDSPVSLVEEDPGLLEGIKSGEDSNQKESLVKGDKNFNFLKDNTVCDIGNDSFKMNLVSDTCVEQSFGKNCCSPSTSSDENSDENGLQRVYFTVDDWECEKEGPDNEGEVKEETDETKAIVFIATKDLKKTENDDVVHVKGDRELGDGDKEMEEGKIEENGEDKGENGENNERTLSLDEENERKAFLSSEENKKMEDVKKEDTEKDDEKKVGDKEENEVDEAIMEKEDVKVKNEEEDTDKDGEKEIDGTEENDLHSFGKNRKLKDEEENKEAEIIVALSLDVEKGIDNEVESKDTFSHDLKKELEDEGKSCLHNEDKKEAKPCLDENEYLNNETSLTIDEGNEMNTKISLHKKDVELISLENKELLCVETNRDVKMASSDNVLNNEDSPLDENKQDVDMVSLYENQEMKNEKGLLDGEQKDEDLLSLDSHKEMENDKVFLTGEIHGVEIGDENKEIKTLLLKKDESKYSNIKLGTPCDRGLIRCSTPDGEIQKDGDENTEMKTLLLKNDESKYSKMQLGTPCDRSLVRCSTPASQSASCCTPTSQSYCTPAKIVLKYWKPSVFRRSSLFASDTELHKAGIDDTPRKCHSIIEEEEEEEDEEDDFEVSLMKLEKKLSEMESELETSSLDKNCSKLEAYHKTVVAEREEDSQKLEEVMAELTSQLLEENSFSQDSDKTLVEHKVEGIAEEEEEEEEEHSVMKEFLEGRNDDLMIVEDIDFANEQNDTVIEMKDEESVVGNSTLDKDEDVLRLTCSDMSSLNDSAASTIRETTDVVSASTSSVATTSTGPIVKMASVVTVAPIVRVEDDDDERNWEFVSDDPLENFDNNNPGWGVLRNITNDSDRYKEIHKRWRSSSIPKPDANLSFHKHLEYKKRKAAPSSSCHGDAMKGNISKKKLKKLNKKRTFVEAFESSHSQDEPPAKRQKCTVVYDREIDDLLKQLEKKRFEIRSQMNKNMVNMALRQEKEMYECVYRRYGDHAQLRSHHIREVGRLTDNFMRELAEAERQTSDYVSMLRHAIDEVITFHAFYEDLDANAGSQCTTNSQLEELLETEEIVSSYAERYGKATK